MKGLREDDRASKIRYALRGEFAYLPAEDRLQIGYAERRSHEPIRDSGGRDCKLNPIPLAP